MSTSNAETDGLRSGLGIWVLCTTMPLRDHEICSMPAQ